ncbi:MAG: hypothetical protein ACJA1B_000573 [Polaribacter sp.]|jgi:hypothetical protein
MTSEEKRKTLAKWILETDENVLNEVEAIYNVSANNISEEHKKILDQRLENHLKNPDNGRNWNEIKADLSKKYAI